MPRLGLVAYGTPTGLGYQTAAAHKHLRPDKTLLIDLSRSKGMPLHPEWFTHGQVTTAAGVPSHRAITGFLADLDMVFMCETPLDWSLIHEARARDIRTICQFNFEFLDHLANPRLPLPTVFAAPSPWNVDRLPATWPVRHLPVPVDAVPVRHVTEARVFTHVHGRTAVHDRNGAAAFLALAAACADLDTEWVLYAQGDLPPVVTTGLRRAPHVHLVRDTPNNTDLHTGDIQIRPRRYGGLCLPTAESLAAGIPVVMTDVPPNNTWLPTEWLVPATHAGTFPTRAPIDLWTVDQGALEALVRRVHADPDTAQEWGKQASALGAGLTWDALRPAYTAFLDEVMEMRP